MMAKVHPLDAATADLLASRLPLSLTAEEYRWLHYGCGLSRAEVRKAVAALVADGRAVVTAGSMGLIVDVPDQEGIP